LQSVEPGGPADKAGIHPGDVVTAVNGQAVKTGSDLVNPIAQTPIGGKVRVSYMRNRQSREATLTVEDRVKIFPERATSNNRNSQPGEKGVVPAEFGLRVEELTPGSARRSEYGDFHGVLVAEVAPVSFAEDLGLLRGDLIAEINHVPVTSLADYRKLRAALQPGQEVVLRVLRRGDSDRMLTILLAGTVPSTEQ